MDRLPNDSKPVLALIEAQSDLGKSQWYEVVYYTDDNWHSFAGSDTFLYGGEVVVNWSYCDECLPREQVLREYVCTDCQAVNEKVDNRKITVGLCDECGHPLWNSVEDVP